jgi:hypothetical protein
VELSAIPDLPRLRRSKELPGPRFIPEDAKGIGGRFSGPEGPQALFQQNGAQHAAGYTRVASKQELIERIHLYFQRINAAPEILSMEVQDGSDLCWLDDCSLINWSN